MTADTDEDANADETPAEGTTNGTPRTTAPMSAFSSRDAGVGILVFLVGTVLAFVIPIAAF